MIRLNVAADYEDGFANSAKEAQDLASNLNIMVQLKVGNKYTSYFPKKEKTERENKLQKYKDRHTGTKDAKVFICWNDKFFELEIIGYGSQSLAGTVLVVAPEYFGIDKLILNTNKVYIVEPSELHDFYAEIRTAESNSEIWEYFADYPYLFNKLQ